ncbi:MAG TPA: glycosyltransferase family 87 protein [Candidatus Binatia bacterium]|nr:glycosyltransferase family 87 protein [Candidatus Binatia bacterium]
MSSVPNALRAAAWRPSPTRRRAIRDGLIVGGLIANGALLAFLPRDFAWFVDAPSWWLIDLSNLYGVANQGLETYGAFRFAPVVAWAMWPLTLLPWTVFLGTYLVLNLAAVVVLGRRWAPLLLLAFPPILLELLNANIHLFMALAIWAGLRWPGAWSFLLLTKVTPGVGVLWFAVRREWRNLALALGITAAIVAVGFVLAPAQWIGWFESLLISAGNPQVGDLPSLAVRLPLAVLLVAFAARTDRAWLVPFGCLLAMPTIWLQSSALLAACFPLWRDRARWQRTGTAGAARSAGSVAQPTTPTEEPAR